jgi:hypothetical protein
MTDPAPTHPQVPPGARPHPIVSILLTIGGVILLLPGLCSLVFIGALFSDSPTGLFDDAGLLLLWVVCLAISFGGIMMIWRAWRRRRPAP